ncbi:MAG: endonuclease/exonuclease/phosphatase family protein [Clostridia bacterium]|nr:endonuclease/exonuclease/phosphatase family protein [Clostridia bacterium]
MNTRKRTLSLLLVLAMLTLAFALIVPVATAAEPEPESEEIQDFDYQTPVNFAVAGATTEMRFLFTIGSLDYTKAGFVFSFESYGNVEEPEIGADSCYTVEATAAYSTIIADGETIPAPDGRWWIAAKVTNIPQDEFNNWIYVRAFVTDGEGTRYSDAAHISPFEAHRGNGESIREYKGTSSKKDYGDLRNVWTDVLQSGAKTFCPTQGNPAGNDLYIEYSVLFSKYLTETYLKASAGPYVVSGVAEGDSMHYALIYWDPCDAKSDYRFTTTGNFTTVAPEDPGLFPNIATGSEYADFPHVGGEDAENPEYGWHRIGIVYHEEVTNVNAVKGGADAEYYLTVSLYIDGRLVSVLCSTDNLAEDSNNYDLKLYTAESDGNGGIVYTDVAETERDQSVYVYRLRNFQYVSGSKIPYCVFADCYATCGNDFVQRVTCVDNYPDYTEYKYATSDGSKSVDAPLYYRIVNDDSFPGTISVMSYNIGVYGGTSGDAQWEGRDPEKVAETILSESPDIVGLQEVNQKNANGWDDTLTSLASSGGYTRLEGSYTGGYNFEKNEIFYKTDKFTELDEGTKTFRATAAELNVPNPENADPDISKIDRIFHYAVLRETATGKTLLVVSAHLHYGGMDEEDHILRRYEIRALLAWLETQRATYPNQIVMGDMNAHYKIEDSTQGHNTMNLFTDGGFDRTNSAAVASVRGDIGGTLAESGRTTRPKWIYDYILTKGNIATAYYTVIDNPIDTDGTYPSDHVPVLAKIYLR